MWSVVTIHCYSNLFLHCKEMVAAPVSFNLFNFSLIMWSWYHDWLLTGFINKGIQGQLVEVCRSLLQELFNHCLPGSDFKIGDKI